MLWALLTRFRYLFYLVHPKESSFQDIDEIPNYINEVIPLFVVFIALEVAIGAVKLRKRVTRINDSFGSLSQGIISELIKLWSHGVLVTGYVAIHQKWRLVSLPWNDTLTWVIGLLTVDFVYYLLHRASHEVNIFWAAHQVHHSSEDYNLTTALRQSVMQNVTYTMFYLPLGLIVPPTIFLVHNQLNLLYQFWIHTELVTKLGPLEYVLNTPSHHRVHHGRNRYCIDANYAGLLIIWDRMFGTFQPEEEEVVYGLTHPINTFDPVTIQLGHYQHIWRALLTTPGLSGKLSVLFKGPGWEPGKPRLGDPQDIPDVHAPASRYDPEVPTWIKTYAVVHFFMVLAGYLNLTFTYQHNAFQMNVLIATAVLLFSLTSIGAILDKKSYSAVMELCRCLFLMSADIVLRLFVSKAVARTLPETVLVVAVKICFACSALIWGTLVYKNSNFLKKKTQ